MDKRIWAIFLFSTPAEAFRIRRACFQIKLTTWLIPETLDWRIVTASPIEGFLEALAAAEALKARVES